MQKYERKMSDSNHKLEEMRNKRARGESLSKLEDMYLSNRDLELKYDLLLQVYRDLLMRHRDLEKNYEDLEHNHEKLLTDYQRLRFEVQHYYSRI